MPPTGSQPVRAASRTSTSEVTSEGSDSRRSEPPRTSEAPAPRRLPVKTPAGNPASVAIASATSASRAVLAARSRTSPPTGR